MKEFMVASKATEEGEKEILEFSIGEDEFQAKVPSTARIAMFIAAMVDEDSGTGSSTAAVFAFLRDVLLEDGYRRLRKLITDDVIGMTFITGGDDLNEDGLVDWIISQAADRPTQPPIDSSPSPAAGGKRSTGRVRGTASTS